MFGLALLEPLLLYSEVYRRQGGHRMITSAFEYHRPSDLAGALSVLEEHGDDARVIAGGHSLIPMMKLRMADVPHLIDLQDIADLKGITIAGALSPSGQ